MYRFEFSLEGVGRRTGHVLMLGTRLEVIDDGDWLHIAGAWKLRDSGGEWTRQFMQGLADGPVPFHYPAPELAVDLFAESD